MSKKDIAVLYGGIGDHILSFPTIAGLHFLFKENFILICTAPMQYIFDPIKQLTILNYELDFKTMTFKNLNYSFTCDTVIIMMNWASLFTKKLFLLQSLLNQFNYKNSIGFSNKFFTNSINSYEKLHYVDQQFCFVKYYNKDLSPLNFIGKFNNITNELDIFNKLTNHYQNKKKFLIIHNDSKQEKVYSTAKLTRVVSSFLNKNPDYITILIGLNSTISKKNESIIHVNLLDLPFYQNIQLFYLPAIFLGIDSCFLHIADIFNLPSIGLFGPTNPKKWGFYFSKKGYCLTSTNSSMNIDENNIAFLLNKIK